jgi:hypothetical protein
MSEIRFASTLVAGGSSFPIAK